MNNERPWAEKNHTVTFWDDTPIETDTCNTGVDFDTLEEANAFFLDVIDGKVDNASDYIRRQMNTAEYFMLDSEDLANPHIVKNPRYTPRKDDDLWRHEMAMQAGMAFGCDGYNDVMGY